MTDDHQTLWSFNHFMGSFRWNTSYCPLASSWKPKATSNSISQQWADLPSGKPWKITICSIGNSTTKHHVSIVMWVMWYSTSYINHTFSIAMNVSLPRGYSFSQPNIATSFGVRLWPEGVLQWRCGLPGRASLVAKACQAGWMGLSNK